MWHTKPHIFRLEAPPASTCIAVCQQLQHPHNAAATAATAAACAAVGLPIYPGLVKVDEVASGEIKHAIRFTSRRIRDAYAWPASHLITGRKLCATAAAAAAAAAASYVVPSLHSACCISALPGLRSNTSKASAGPLCQRMVGFDADKCYWSSVNGSHLVYVLCCVARAAEGGIGPYRPWMGLRARLSSTFKCTNLHTKEVRTLR
jgi:hypothetical protein